MKLLFLLLISITVTHGCLRVHSPEPPKCECPYMVITEFNIAELENHNFYQNISKQNLEGPMRAFGDCSMWMYCDPEYSLVVFDTKDAVMFGEDTAKGVCDPYTQKWKASHEGELRTFDRLYGTCVGYGQCRCRASMIIKENVDTLLENHPFRKNITSYVLGDPRMSGKDCSASFWCGEGYSLVMFSSKEAVIFGEYRAEGFCEPMTQTYQVADATGLLKPFDELYGACVDYGTPKATEPPQSECPCAFKEITTSNAKEYIGHFDLYLKDLSRFDIVTPETIIYTGGCASSIYCPLRTSRYLFTDILQFEATDSVNLERLDLRCDSSLQWTVIPYNDVSPFRPDFIMPFCVNFSAILPTPNPPTTPMCSCKNQMIQSSLDRKTIMNNIEVKSTVSDNHCRWEISCRNRAVFNAVVEIGGEKYFSDGLDARCSPDNSKWTIRNTYGESWSYIEVFSFGCTKQLPNFEDLI